ncbi:MAG TPA: tetratricopeptide repeat protein, partial [Casimicrobiaceae bacterium]|nr:tetratricopeptide repeat protein [Casimicrobiaceae bacterium]
PKAPSAKRSAILAALMAAVGGTTVSAQTTPAPPIVVVPAPATQLSADIMYRILVGDIALQRGEPALAARAYYEAARDAQDATLARRATEIALFARQRTLAMDAAQLWEKLDPSSDRAKQMVTMLGQPGASGDLKGDLERLLADAAAGGKTLGDAFLQLNRALSAQTDKVVVYRLVSDLAKPYPGVAEAQFAVALAAYNTGLTDVEIAAASMRAVDRALQLKPGWERAALVKADILAKGSPESAIRYLNAFLTETPESRAAATALAQLYVEQKRYNDARAVFQRLRDADPSDRELEYAVAAISLQMKDYPTAERLFEELKAADFGEPGIVAFYLAEIAEETRRYDEAIARYREVTEGDRAWLAKLRIAAIMGKQGQFEPARQFLRTLDTDGREQEIQVKQAEAQLLQDARDYPGAYAVLTAALAGEPDSAELLYDVAMVAEKLDRLDEVESRLKRVIELKPENAQALNALGYTLVDRTQRAAEGMLLIEKAHALAPSDPFILDSMGWAHFRLGHFDESEKFLRRALAERPDPEIAAHLGEVLWAKGERDRAQEVWQSQLKETPDNPVLLDTVRRLAR